MRIAVGMSAALAVVLCASPARAQFPDASEVEPEATACAYTFTSGSGLNAFTWCVTVNGNVAKFETPAGQNHMTFTEEGYAVCSAAGTHGADFGTFIAQPFGPPTVLAGCVSGTTCTISRDTVDGVFRLVQKFSQNVKEKELNIDHTLTNLTTSTVLGVTLTRMSRWGVNNTYNNERGDKSARSVWMAEADSISNTASTFTEAATPNLVGSFPAGCAPGVVATPAPPGAYANQINYNVGNLGPGKKKLLRVQIRRH